MPLATEALRSRAPSRCSASPWRRPSAQTSRTWSSGHTTPPPPLLVFSSESTRVGARWRIAGSFTSGPHVLGAEEAAAARDPLDHEARVERRPADLVADDVRELLGDDLLARLGEELERDLVRHRRGGQEDGRLVAEQRGGALLEAVDARVLAALLVPDLGFGDRPPHAVGGKGGGVGAKVDHAADATRRAEAAQPPGRSSSAARHPAWRDSRRDEAIRSHGARAAFAPPKAPAAASSRPAS